MARQPFIRLGFVCALLSCSASACKGCGDDEESTNPSPADEALSRAFARMEQRGLTFKQSYDRRADGSVDCKGDAVCFVAQAKSCADSWFEHREEITDLGVTQITHSRYRMFGIHKDRCHVLRQLLGVGAEIEETTRRAMLEKGKSEADLQSLVLDHEAVLRSRNFQRAECRGTTAEVLELALDIEAEVSSHRRLQKMCREVPVGAEWVPALLAPSTLYAPLGSQAAPSADDAGTPTAK